MMLRDGIEDSLERDRRFRRAGWRRAWAVALAIVAAVAVLGRIAPPEEATTVRRTPRWTWVLPDAEAALADVRAVRSPTAFALPTPSGFTGSLRARAPRLAPPVRRTEAMAYAPSAAAAPRPAAETDWNAPEFVPVLPLGIVPRGWTPVFANRTPPSEEPRMEFPSGWEQRLFAGVDLAYAGWAPGREWTASAELEFDERGILTAILLDRSSGIPRVDRRLARSAAGWRLLDAGAPRRGRVVWRVPAPAAPAAAPPAAPVPAATEEGALP